MEPNNLNEWWGGQPDGLKQAFSLFPDDGGKRRTCICESISVTTAS